MALKDVKKYYFTMLAQYLEMKADLADFEQALQNNDTVMIGDLAEYEKSF